MGLTDTYVQRPAILRDCFRNMESDQSYFADPANKEHIRKSKSEAACDGIETRVAERFINPRVRAFIRQTCYHISRA